jgi:hypothetical protein
MMLDVRAAIGFAAGVEVPWALASTAKREAGARPALPPQL